MSFKRRALFGVTTAVFTATAVFAGSHSTPESKAVEARQAHMQLYAFNLGILGGMAKGEMDFDAATAQGAADNLAALASLSQGSYWIANTTSNDMENSRALPIAPENYADVGAKSEALITASVAMQNAAGSLDGIRGAIGAVGGACGACHKAYRAPAN